MEKYPDRLAREITDEQIIELYFQREERAIEETDHKYGVFLYRIAHNILHDHSDSEECQNDTYLKLWNTIPPTRPIVFPSFAARIIRNIAINRYKSKMNKKHIPSELTVSMEDLEEYLYSEESMEKDCLTKELASLINEFMETLSARRQYIFVGRFYMADTLETIAAELGIHVSSPSARLSEIVTTLLCGVIAFGFAVLVLSVIFHMKARHRELAVLSALGKKRGAVARSFFAEVLILTTAALLVSSGLLCLTVRFFAEPIGRYLVASEFSASIVPERADMFLIESGVQNTVTTKMNDLSYLFSEYAIPSILFSLIAGLIILMGIYFVVCGYVRKINALSGVGGKE